MLLPTDWLFDWQLDGRNRQRKKHRWTDRQTNRKRRGKKQIGLSITINQLLLAPARQTKTKTNHLFHYRLYWKIFYFRLFEVDSNRIGFGYLEHSKTFNNIHSKISLNLFSLIELNIEWQTVLFPSLLLILNDKWFFCGLLAYCAFNGNSFA